MSDRVYAHRRDKPPPKVWDVMHWHFGAAFGYPPMPERIACPRCSLAAPAGDNYCMWCGHALDQRRIVLIAN